MKNILAKIPKVTLIQLVESAALWAIAETIVHRKGDPLFYAHREAANSAADTLRANIRAVAMAAEFAATKLESTPEPKNLP